MSNKNTAYWIWHYGDYEIYHTMLVHFRREERGFTRPAVWKVSTPYPSVQFIKTVKSEKAGYIYAIVKGEGSVVIDGKFYPTKTRLELSAGEHQVEVRVCNYKGLPCCFVKSDICPSDGSWVCNHFAGKLTCVGYNEHFVSEEQNPEVFPFSYKRIKPLSKEKVEGGLLFDFGVETFGFLNVKGARKNEELGLFYGESREEALDTDYTYVTDFVSGETEYRLKQRAFRYVYVQSSNEAIEVSADYEYLPFEKRGNFECDNKLFNDICTLASYTFHLNCREGFFDGIKRDRWIWSGDAYQSCRINRYLFADKEIEQRTLIGLIGKEPIEQHINTILDYSLIWVIMLYEHYTTYADKEFIARIYPMAKKLVQFCETRLNSDGFLEGIEDDWTFIDWSDIEKVGAVCAEQMLLVKTYSAMAYICKEIGQSDECEYEDKSKKLLAKINEYYWDDEKGAFIDGYKSGNRNVTRHANIFAVMYDLATKEQAQSILKNVLKNDSITKITTPYFEGYELDALAKLGDFKAVESMLSSYWGGMIDLGATTIWEEYCPTMTGIEHYAMYGGKYEKSLCHAWGAGPIYLFGRYYLGVYATKAGYETFNVEPKTCGLKKIRGIVPVNGGEVRVEMDEKRLSVTATKSGGTLIFKGKEYSLSPNECISLDV